MKYVIDASKCRVELRGDVTMDTVKEMPVLPLSSGEKWCIDMSGVSHSDSVLIAVLCGFERQCTLVGSSFQLVEMPKKMMNLTALYGLTERLGLR